MMWIARVDVNAAVAGMCALVMGSLQPASAMPPNWCPMSAPVEEPPPGGSPDGRCRIRGVCDDPDERDQWIPGAGTSDMAVRIQFIVFCNDPLLENCAVRDADLDQQLARLDEDFASKKIKFVEGGARIFVEDPRFYDFCGAQQVRNDCLCSHACRDNCDSEETDMKTTYAPQVGEQSQINVFIVRDLFTNVGNFGIAYWWHCDDASRELGGILMDGRCIGDTRTCYGLSGAPPNKTLTHEVGHALGLYHVFRGTAEVGTGCDGCYEGSECVGFVNGECPNPDCEEVGDFCCDTPGSIVGAQCGTESSLTGCPGDIVGNPARHNQMSYAPDTCRTFFTNQQAGRMHCWTCDSNTGWLTDAATGACCRSDGSCTITTETCCDNVGGTFGGDGTKCDEGACCMGDGTCYADTEGCCLAAGGGFGGGGSVCGGPIGACCLQPYGTCVQSTQACCTAAGGFPFTPGYSCGHPLACPAQQGPQPWP